MTPPIPPDPASDSEDVHPDEFALAVDELNQRVRQLRGYSKRLRAQQRRAETHAQQVPQLKLQLQRLEARVKTQSEAIKRNTTLWAKILRLEGVQWAHQWREERLSRRLSRLSDSGRPVVVGPWRGEVGIELLYWMPFVSWVFANTPIAQERTTVVSRGGVESWYGGIGTSYVDALDVLTVDEYRRAGILPKKQRQLTRPDVTLIRAVQALRDGQAVQLVHPKLMFELFQPFWRGEHPVSTVEALTRYRVLPRPAPAPWRSQLPDEYVAVKFYFGTQFPDTPENRRFAVEMIERLARKHHVVVLDPNVQLDDHESVLASGDNIHQIHHLPMSPAKNLDVQSQIVAHAKFFVGTYGGLAHLPPYYGVPCLAVYSNVTGFFDHHLDYALRVFRRLTDAPFLVLNTSDLSIIRAAVDTF